MSMKKLFQKRNKNKIGIYSLQEKNKHNYVTRKI